MRFMAKRLYLGFDCGLDAFGISAPMANALFDRFGFEVLGEGLVDQRGDFFVGSKAECDELFGREFAQVGSFVGGEKRGETEALFEADETILNPEIVDATFEA